MQQLFNLPEVQSQTILRKRDAAIPDLSVLRGKQVDVVNGILERLKEEGGCIIVLEGVAGGGKTFCVSRIIESYLSDKWNNKVAFSATTNRAVKVSFRSTEFTHPCLEFSTIHKLLALREVILPDGSKDFYPDKFAIPSIKEYTIVFIDESSQFSKKLWGYLLPYIELGLKVVFVGDPCFAKGTEVIMFNGSVKKIETINIGDSLMGVDSSKRTVVKLFNGYSSMYDIIQTNGESYRVTPLHKIAMIRRHTKANISYIRYPEYGDEFDITAEELYKKSGKFFEVFAGYKKPIEFPTKPVLVDAYFLGLWLGDDESTSIRISNPDNEVVTFCREYATTLGMVCGVYKEGNKNCYRISITGMNKGKGSNFIFDLMRQYKVISNKHIPDAYKINDTLIRLNVLAGLIDSDGHYDSKGHRFIIANTNVTLINDIITLSRSLGFKTEQHIMQHGGDGHSMQNCFAINISGNIHLIPTKVHRKIALYRAGTKDLSYSTISIKRINAVQEYFGFELDGDNRFLLRDFTVAHNCQTPPVKENDSLIFDPVVQRRHEMLVFKLTEIVRQAADNPIIGVATLIRDNLSKHISLGNTFSYEDQLWQSDKGVHFINKRNQLQRGYFDELLKHVFCSANFEADTNFGKVVCWRNKTVAKMNKGIRTMIYHTDKLRRIEPMEKIIAKQPIWDLDYDTIIVGNAEQMEVVDFSRQSESINDGQYTLHYYDTKVRFYDFYGNEVLKRINIPTDKGIRVFNEITDLLAKVAKSYTPGTFAAKNAWADFWRFNKSYADIQHDYAGTIHAVQGSSVNNTIVMECDVLANPKVVERNKIMYTGVTRAVDRLFIV